MAQWLTNPTRNHEVAGSIPGLAQWCGPKNQKKKKKKKRKEIYVLVIHQAISSSRNERKFSVSEEVLNMREVFQAVFILLYQIPKLTFML